MSQSSRGRAGETGDLPGEQRRKIFAGLLGPALFVLALVGCSETDWAVEPESASEPVHGSAATDRAGGDPEVSEPPIQAAPRTDPSRYSTVAEFEGFADPARGTLEVRLVRASLPRVPSAARLSSSLDLRTQGQPVSSDPSGWCALDVHEDAIEGANPADTIELITNPGTLSRDHSTCEGLLSLVHGINDFDSLFWSDRGVLCGAITLRHFYTGAELSNVHAEITDIVGNSEVAGHYQSTLPGYGVAGDLLVGRTPPQLGNGGLFPLGSFGVPDGSALSWPAFNAPCDGDPATCPDEATSVWAFHYANDAPFRFSGRLVQLVSEECGDGIDDDCDGIADNACQLFDDGDPCLADADCASGTCDGASLRPEVFGTCASSVLQVQSFGLGASDGRGSTSRFEVFGRLRSSSGRGTTSTFTVEGGLR